MWFYNYYLMLSNQYNKIKSMADALNGEWYLYLKMCKCM